MPSAMDGAPSIDTGCPPHGQLEPECESDLAVTHEQTDSLFFKLPAELRNAIYDHALRQTLVLTWKTERWNKTYTRAIHPLLMTCKKLCHEAIPFVCGTLRVIYPVEKPMLIWTALQHQSAPVPLVLPSVRELHVCFEESRFLYFSKFAAQVDAIQSFINATQRLEKVVIRVKECDCRLWRYEGPGGHHAPGCESANVIGKLKKLEVNCQIDLGEGELEKEEDDDDQLEEVIRRADLMSFQPQ